ncbi:Solute-binding protein [subsurface metagenome]
MKGKSIKIIDSIVFVLIFVMLVSACSLATDKPIVIKYSDSDPPGGMRTVFVKDVWFPEIIKQTNGRVKIQDFWGSALLGPPEALKGVKDGVTDIAMIFADFYPKQLAIYQTFKLFPRSPAKWENIAWIYHKAFEEIPEFQAELEAWNQKLLFVTVGLPSAFAATYPIKSIDDLKRKKWRASSIWHLKDLERLDVIPVSVPWVDVYMALSTGTIDGVLTNYDGLHMMKFYEAAPNLLLAPGLWWATPFLHTINLDKWNSLPPDVQEGILKASKIAEEKFSETFKEAFNNTVAEEKKAGCTITFMSEEDVKIFADEDFFKGLRNIWIKDAKEQGIKDAAYYINRLKLIIEEGIKKEE